MKYDYSYVLCFRCITLNLPHLEYDEFNTLKFRICCSFISILLEWMWNLTLTDMAAMFIFTFYRLFRGDIFLLSNRWDALNTACLLQLNLAGSSWILHGNTDWFNDVYLIKSQLRRQINLFNSLLPDEYELRYHYWNMTKVLYFQLKFVVFSN